MYQPQTLLAGCSFTDPLWQKTVPWSTLYSHEEPCYLIAKAGMGIRGICTEVMYYLPELESVNKIIIILPTLWRLEIEMDQETYLCNAMVDLLAANQGNIEKIKMAQRKWIISGLNYYDKKTEEGKIFEFLYKHQGFLVILKEHIRALRSLLNYADSKQIDVHISAIKDPLDQLVGLDYIKDQIIEELDSVGYQNWFRFDGKFIDGFLGHAKHPNDLEHQLLLPKIIENTNRK